MDRIGGALFADRRRRDPSLMKRMGKEGYVPGQQGLYIAPGVGQTGGHRGFSQIDTKRR